MLSTRVDRKWGVCTCILRSMFFFSTKVEKKSQRRTRSHVGRRLLVINPASLSASLAPSSLRHLSFLFISFPLFLLAFSSLFIRAPSLSPSFFFFFFSYSLIVLSQSYFHPSPFSFSFSFTPWSTNCPEHPIILLLTNCLRRQVEHRPFFLLPGV